VTVLIVFTSETFEVDRYEGHKNTHHAVISERYRDDYLQSILDGFRTDPPLAFSTAPQWGPLL
jgi:hypothetical protein